MAWQWYLTTVALVGPDIVLTARELLRRRRHARNLEWDPSFDYKAERSRD